MVESPKPETFDEYYYNHDCGIPYEHSEHWLNFFDRIAQKIIETINPKTVLDAGCAWGFLVEALRKRGVEAYGIDISEYAISNVTETIKPYCSQGSISMPLNRSYDLIVSIEVLEHMETEEAIRAIQNFSNYSDRILFSSTPFDYKEVTHINVHLPEYWAKNFSLYGYYRDLDYDASYITAWATLYTKRQLTADRIVFEYERSYWPLIKENYDLRQHIFENQNALKEIEAKYNAAILETQNYQNLMSIYKDSLVEKDTEIRSLNQTIAKSQERFQEINVHWNALTNSTTWKTLNKLGKFKDFPDLTT